MRAVGYSTGMLPLVIPNWANLVLGGRVTGFVVAVCILCPPLGRALSRDRRHRGNGNRRRIVWKMLKSLKNLVVLLQIQEILRVKIKFHFWLNASLNHHLIHMLGYKNRRKVYLGLWK